MLMDQYDSLKDNQANCTTIFLPSSTILSHGKKLFSVKVKSRVRHLINRTLDISKGMYFGSNASKVNFNEQVKKSLSNFDSVKRAESLLERLKKVKAGNAGIKYNLLITKNKLLPHVKVRHSNCITRKKLNRSIKPETLDISKLRADMHKKRHYLLSMANKYITHDTNKQNSHKIINSALIIHKRPEHTKKINIKLPSLITKEMPNLIDIQ